MKSVRPLTKGHLYALTITAIFLLLQSSMIAATITWTAGNANWNNPGNWDTGSIPTAVDHVIIPAGRAKIPFGYAATALSIDIQGDVWIRSNAQLLLANASNEPSVNLSGRLTIDGHLAIENSVYTGILNTGIGFYSTGLARIRANGSMYIHNTDRYGILNQSSATFINHGDLTIEDSEDSSIYNLSSIRNYGTIDIDIGIDIAAIVNGGQFDNYVDGEINTDGGGNSAIINWENHTFNNWGEIAIRNVAIHGFHNSGDLINYSSGSIQTPIAGYSGLYNRTTGDFQNNGAFTALGCGNTGILNEGIIYNTDWMILSGAYSDMRDYAGATLENDGTLKLLSTDNSLVLNGTLTNIRYLWIDGRADLLAGSILENNGFVISDYALSHILLAGAQCINHGVIEDVQDSFGSIVNNQQVMAKPLSGILQNGVAFSNPLEATSLSNVTVNGWYESSTGPEIGFYDAVNNTLTPNSNAIGLSSIQAKITINSTGIFRYVAIDLSTPVAAMVNPGSDIIIDAGKFRTTDENNDLAIYPNPTIGEVNLSGSVLQNDAIQILVLNQLGQVVLEKKGYGAEALQFQLPDHLANGNYRVVCLQEGKLITTKNIVLNKD